MLRCARWWSGALSFDLGDEGGVSGFPTEMEFVMLFCVVDDPLLVVVFVADSLLAASCICTRLLYAPSTLCSSSECEPMV